MKLTHVTALALLTTAVTAAADNRKSTTGFFYDAIALAILHFNADHAKDIQSWGPEHRFMLKALTAVETAVPGVTGIHVVGSSPQAGEPFVSLNQRYDLYKTSPDADREKAAKELEAAVSAIVGGCPKHTVMTTEIYDNGTGNAEPRTHEVVEYSLNDDYSKKCDNKDLVAKLAPLGVGTLTVTREDAGYRKMVSASLHQATNLWRDMAWIRSRLLEIPAIAPVAQPLAAWNPNPAVIGQSSKVTLVKDNGPVTMTTPFKLSYFKGWGDCPAGCINRHYWQIEVTPVPATTAAEIEFKVSVLSESGSPLPQPGEDPQP